MRNDSALSVMYAVAIIHEESEFLFDGGGSEEVINQLSLKR